MSIPKEIVDLATTISRDDILAEGTLHQEMMEIGELNLETIFTHGEARTPDKQYWQKALLGTTRVGGKI